MPNVFQIGYQLRMAAKMAALIKKNANMAV